MSINIPTDRIIKDAELRAEQALVKSLDLAIGECISELMHGPRYTHRSGVGKVQERGALYGIIKDKIETYALSDCFEERIEAAVDKHLDSCTDEAVQRMLLSASRRRVFGAVPHK